MSSTFCLCLVMPELEKLRQDIDAIDDAMQDLLLKRVTLVSEIARIKDGALPLRPEREASILRRLARRHRGVLPLGSLFRIWREIISANSQLQAAFSVMLWQKEDDLDSEKKILWNLLRDFYGFSTPVAVEGNAGVILEKIEQDPFLLGVLPAPDGNPAGRWWCELARRSGKLVIIGCLPFLLDESGPQEKIRALVVACAPFSASGLDTSLIAWQLSDGVRRDDARECLNVLEKSVRVLDSISRGGQGRADQLLLAVDGYSDVSDAALLSLKKGGTVKFLGGYANPWSEGAQR